jgi:uncharacterized BrkB/YihY/UPF0761 family membrane protein
MRPSFSQRQIALIVVFVVVALMALALSATGVIACPDCPASRSARANVLAGSFWTNLGLVSLPLVVLVGICALLYRVGASRIEGDPPP